MTARRKTEAAGEPGYDGQPPVFVAARGSEVIDPKTGKVLREAADGQTNINVDRLAYMLNHGLIESYQHDAGRMLQADWESAERLGYGVLSGTRGVGTGGSDVSQHRIDAMRRRNAARDYLGPETFRMIEMVCLERASVERAAARMGRHPKLGMGLFLAGLDTLARFYRLA